MKLPLRELYEGLGLPVPDSEPSGTLGELLSVSRTLNQAGQEMVLMFARHTPAYLAIAQPQRLVETATPPAPPALSPEEAEREAYTQQIMGKVAAMTTEQLAKFVEDLERRQAAIHDARRLGEEPVEPTTPRSAAM